MAYSDTIDRIGNGRIITEYEYDAFGRRTITQDAGRTAMRTLYDGFTFEVIRDSETFQYGGFTVKGSPGIVAPSSPVQGVDDSSRFRLVTEGYSTWLPDGAPQGRANGETAVSAERKYVGISTTLYANGEAVAVNRYDTATFTGGTVYLGKDALGSVRGATNDYGLLEERYEYDAFGKPYEGDLNSGMNLGYTGKPYDTATGMYNYGYRDYQPEVARFTTVDPIRDGANWFAYVNNDPVNWVDPWGLSANDKKGGGFWGAVADIVGKIWAAPMTAIGIVAGAVLTGVSIITGNGGSVSFENNAITFTTGLNLNGSITLGNTIIHAGPVMDGEPWDSQKDTDRYDGTAEVNLGKHEEAHTYQYQKLGIFTIPAIIGSAILNGGIGAGDGSFHDFMEQSDYEKAADDYAQFGTSPIP